MRERFERVREQLGFEENVDVQELMYDDPERSDVQQWLNDHGWRAGAAYALEVQRQLGRAVEINVDDEDLFSSFVTAERSEAAG